jgi:hypothetical protein
MCKITVTKAQIKAAKYAYAALILSELWAEFEPLSPARIRIDSKIKELDLKFKQAQKEHEENSN